MLFRAGRNLIRGLILIACVGLQSTEDAAAADIPYPVKAPAVVDVPPSWDGFYLGGQVGYGMDWLAGAIWAVPRCFRRSIRSRVIAAVG